MVCRARVFRFCGRCYKTFLDETKIEKIIRVCSDDSNWLKLQSANIFKQSYASKLSIALKWPIFHLRLGKKEFKIFSETVF